jgi:hypothetical protein
VKAGRATAWSGLAALAAFVAAAAPACWESSAGCHASTSCAGNTLHVCIENADTGGQEETTDCTASGQVCRQSGGVARCVFADRPCTQNTCLDDRTLTECSPLGLVAADLDCTAYQPGRTCLEGSSGSICGYAAVSCPASGANKFCDAEGVTLYSGCAGQAHPQDADDCSSYQGEVCKTLSGSPVCLPP